MARNIEIKAKAGDFQRQMSIAAHLAGDEPQRLTQTDTFFAVPHGRLKLREFGDGTGELIHYHRANKLEPTACEYVIHPVSRPAGLKDTLTNALGVRAVVKKKRIVYMVGRTRVHLDDVEDLGQFLELEVVLEDGEDAARGAAIADDLMARLEIDPGDLIEQAYVDLLEEAGATSQR
jgi:predicted adenylyl cyclase CyaB